MKTWRKQTGNVIVYWDKRYKVSKRANKQILIHAWTNKEVIYSTIQSANKK